MESENTKQHPTTCINIEQQRAAYALKHVSEKTKMLDKETRKEWLSRANELPAMIQMNGIGATVAFYQMKDSQKKQKKDDNAYRGLLDILQNWLCTRDDSQKNDKEKDDRAKGIYSKDDDLMSAIVNGDMHSYRAAQAEAQALLIWVKKFSKVHCRDTETNKGDQP